MEYITIKNNKISLDPINEQNSPLGRPFRLSGIALDLTVQPVYNSKLNMYFHPTIYTFRYTDKQDGFFGFYFNANNQFSHKL